jgi:RCC1 and BTB domain-containing protein
MNFDIRLVHYYYFLTFIDCSFSYTWGEGKFGRLGHGAERNCHSPRLVESLLGKRPRQIACGGFHSAVITQDGKMYTFGGGEHGQLGQ